MKTILTLFLITTIFNSSIQDAVYNALNSDSVENVDQALTIIEKEPNENSTIRAYRGTLLMKKAGFISGPLNKLEMFKQGNKLLEAEIEGNPKNAEYRFLRLTIQEHAPKILGYNNNLDEDKLFIIQHFASISGAIKSHIRKYTSRSKILKESDLID